MFLTTYYDNLRVRIAAPVIPFSRSIKRTANTPLDVNIGKKIVQLYKPDLLKHISQIQDLPTGPYGQYETGHADTAGMEPIFINRQRIHNELEMPAVAGPGGHPYDPVQEAMEDADTIVHEATHEIEHTQHEQGMGSETTEAGPMAAEQQFQNWIQNNLQKIENLPEIKALTAGMHLTKNYSKMKVRKRRSQ
jgi:hypothetical protein